MSAITNTWDDDALIVTVTDEYGSTYSMPSGNLSRSSARRYIVRGAHRWADANYIAVASVTFSRWHKGA